MTIVELKAKCWDLSRQIDILQAELRKTNAEIIERMRLEKEKENVSDGDRDLT